jgi:hypothetical protein
MQALQEGTMRFLLCTAVALAACGRTDTAREAQTADTAAAPAMAETTATPAPPAPAPDTALTARLVGSWTARGYDSGSTRPQRFTITWSRSPDGGVTGKLAFRQGETYNVKVVSTSDSTVVYESDPHQSPTLKAEVVTRTEAQLSGDSLTGKYEARAKEGGKTLSGRFSAKRAQR